MNGRRSGIRSNGRSTGRVLGVVDDVDRSVLLAERKRDCGRLERLFG